MDARRRDCSISGMDVLLDVATVAEPATRDCPIVRVDVGVDNEAAAAAAAAAETSMLASAAAADVSSSLGRGSVSKAMLDERNKYNTIAGPDARRL